ncbi:site-specific integrase [Peribacillus asahii]|uniref:site-specific integrase n=1 Tax=Peribacillus asahii TaxID=228899 RepID=UPI003805E754
MKGIKNLKVEQKKMCIYQKSDIAELELMQCLDTVPLNWEGTRYLNHCIRCSCWELVGLEWKHVNFEKETILIEQSLTIKKGKGVQVKSTKTERSRFVSVPPFAMQVLKELKHEKNKARLQAAELWASEWDGVERDFVFTAPNAFGRPTRPDSVTQWWERFFKKNDHLKYINFHGLRHTSVSILIDENTPMKAISERMGHAKIGTSMDIYGHLLEEADKRAAASMDKVFGDLGVKINM